MSKAGGVCGVIVASFVSRDLRRRENWSNHPRWLLATYVNGIRRHRPMPMDLCVFEKARWFALGTSGALDRSNGWWWVLW